MELEYSSFFKKKLLNFLKHFVVAELMSCLTLCDPMDCSMPGPFSSTVSQSLLRFMAVELVMLSHPLPFPSPFAFNLSQHFIHFFILFLAVLGHCCCTWALSSGGE